MTITIDTRVADIATAEPATIRVFQRHQIDFCCGGKVPLAAACAEQGLDADALVTELQAALAGGETARDWSTAPLTELVGHIQRRYHETLRADLPRLGAMLEKVVSRHGDRRPETLLPLRETFQRFHAELLHHMRKEDAVLFPGICALEEAGTPAAAPWLADAIRMMEAEHQDAGGALTTMRALTRGFAPPDDACPTFRGLYYGLAGLEGDMHMHVHLENNILFPRAAALAVAPRPVK